MATKVLVERRHAKARRAQYMTLRHQWATCLARPLLLSRPLAAFQLLPQLEDCLDRRSLLYLVNHHLLLELSRVAHLALRLLLLLHSVPRHQLLDQLRVARLACLHLLHLVYRHQLVLLKALFRATTRFQR